MRFREVVAEEFRRRQELNPRYSLRGFSRAVGFHHATLSRLLGGSKPTPSRSVSAIGRRIGLSHQQINAFTATENQAAVVLAIGRSTFRPDSRWLASVSGIPTDSVNIALQTLLRTGSLSMSSPSRWHLREDDSE